MYNQLIMDQMLNELRDWVDQNYQMDFTITEDSITVQKTGGDGFLVILWGGDDGTFVVNYGHYWHGHYGDKKEAVEWFKMGVEGRSRLVCTYRWRYLVKAIAQYADNDQWVTVDTTGSCLGFLVWWLPKRIKIYQNNLQIDESQREFEY